MAVALHGVTRLPGFEVVSVDVVECILLPLLDCHLQVIDSFQQRDVNRKAVCFVEAENPRSNFSFSIDLAHSLALRPNSPIRYCLCLPMGSMLWIRPYTTTAVLFGGRTTKTTLLKSGVFTGKSDSKLEWTLETYGINLKKVMCIIGVDYTRT